MKLKIIYTILLSTLATYVQAQDHTKIYVTKAGDTIRIGTAIRINQGKVPTYVYPNFTGDETPIRINAIKRTFATFVGNTYPIARLTRIPVGKRKDGNYKEIGVLYIKDDAMFRDKGLEFFVNIEDALLTGEITIMPGKASDYPKVVQQSESPTAADELLKYKQLLDSGAITQEEYDTQKKKLLAK